MEQWEDGAEGRWGSGKMEQRENGSRGRWEQTQDGGRGKLK